ncbi:MAG TPA: methyltransferase domain-containing protein [Terracidiphilus sp.]|nr:methyltransferase domain-containing protein [Terracidiphilus sp.]
MLKKVLPKPVRAWLRGRRQALDRKLLVLDRVTDWGVLRRTTPYRSGLGGRRGSYIDRFYIEAFLARHREAIRGHVVEIQSDEYTVMFGDGRVTKCDILDINPANEQRTLALDLTQTDEAPENAFDCAICTQTLLLIRDYPAAIRTLYRMLKPGGDLLVTVPGICPVIRGPLVAGEGEDWWRFTGRSAQYAFAEVFGAENVRVETYGNVLAATAFLHGLVQEELTREELESHDPDYEMIVAVRATRPAER